jgi:hypothetical protein
MLTIREFIETAVITAILVITGMLAYRHFYKPLIAATYSTDANKLSPVVRLVTPDGRTYCTGIVVSNNTIFTAGHCVVQKDPFLGAVQVIKHINIRAHDNLDRKIIGTTIYLSPQMDQAVLTGDFSMFQARPAITDIATLVASVTPGVTLTSCGYPLGGDIYCSKTVYLGRTNFMWLVRGILLPSMSGGPTMLEDGRVVAINDAVEDEFSVVSPLFNTPLTPPKK